MIRYSAFDPPEYAGWRPDPEVIAHFRRIIEENDERKRIISAMTCDDLLGLYAGMVRNRLHDIMLKRWVRQGIATKAWLGTGEEAATIGPVHALTRGVEPDGTRSDFVAPMIRNAGACHEMGMPVADMLRGYLGTADSPTAGRDLHIGDFTGGVLAPVSPVGIMVPVATGVALAFKLKKQPRVALTWIGDGSTKSGPFHEGMSLAAAQRVPLIVILQNNQVALGTRLEAHHRGSFEALRAAYGVEGWSFDGNNVLDAFAAVKIAVNLARDTGRVPRGPFLLVTETFRMGGHATHDEREARQTLPPGQFADWGKRDPIGMFERYLIEGSIDLETGARAIPSPDLQSRNEAVLAAAEQTLLSEVNAAAEQALDSLRNRMPRPESGGTGVYSDSHNAAREPPGAQSSS